MSGDEKPDEENKSKVEIRQEVGGGILSDGQIEYLIGDDELSANAEKQRRRKIRNNFQSAIVDLALLSRLENKDLVRVMAPLLNPDHAEDVGQGLYKEGLISKKEARYLDIADAANNPQAQEAMRQGMVGLLAMVTYLIGPENAGAIAERGINEGQGRVALAIDKDLDLYDLRLNPVSVSERIEDYDFPE